MSAPLPPDPTIELQTSLTMTIHFGASVSQRELALMGMRAAAAGMTPSEWMAKLIQDDISRASVQPAIQPAA